MKRKPVHVEVELGKDAQSTHQLIKKFIQKCKKAGIVRECKKRRYFVSAGKKRRSKKSAAKKRFLKKVKNR